MNDTDFVNPDAVGSEALQNAFLRARANALDDGLFRLKGAAAIAEAPAAEGRLGILRDALLEQAGSPDQRTILGPDLDTHLALARDEIARHVARATEAWDRDVRAERIRLLNDQARRDYADPEKLALYADAAASASARPDEARSGLWRAAIDAALTAGQHGTALDLHKNAQDRLTPEDSAALKPVMAIAAQMQKGRDYVAGLLPQPMPATFAETQAAREAASGRNTADWAHEPEQQATNQHLIDAALCISLRKPLETEGNLTPVTRRFRALFCSHLAGVSFYGRRPENESGSSSAQSRRRCGFDRSPQWACSIREPDYFHIFGRRDAAGLLGRRRKRISAISVSRSDVLCRRGFIARSDYLSAGKSRGGWRISPQQANSTRQNGGLIRCRGAAAAARARASPFPAVVAVRPRGLPHPLRPRIFPPPSLRVQQPYRRPTAPALPSRALQSVQLFQTRSSVTKFRTRSWTC